MTASSNPPPAQALSWPHRALLVSGAACWMLVGMVAWAVESGATLAFEASGLRLWRTADGTPAGPQGLDEGVRDLTALGGVVLRNLLALLAAAVLLFGHRRIEAGWLIAAVASGWAVNSALKTLVGRARPDVVPPLMEAGGMSFPSGHSFGAAVVFLAIAIAFARSTERRGVRRGLIAGAMALSGLVAWSRVWLGVHYPSDAIAGWLGGTGWALLAAALLPHLTNRPARTGPAAVPP